MGTKIKWATESWNPITGCTKISPGCKNCYAERMSKRLAGRSGYPKSESECPICGEVYDRAEPFCMEHPNAKLIRRSPFDVTIHGDKLDLPLKWRKPRRIFPCSMGDLFHKNVPDDLIVKVFTVAQLTSRHTYMILTKRPGRMAEYLQSDAFWHEVFYASIINARRRGIEWEEKKVTQLKNVWLGVTAENQAMADERIPTLSQIPAAVRFVSVEPMLEDIILQGGNVPVSPSGPWPDEPLHSRAYLRGVANDVRIGWIILGGETGPGARPMNPDWARSVRDQCQAAGVKFFFKKHGAGNNSRLLDGREWNEHPGDA